MTQQEIDAADDLSMRIGMRIARQLFQTRGNHSEVHLAEQELAGLCAAAAYEAMERQEAAVANLVAASELALPWLKTGDFRGMSPAKTIGAIRDAIALLKEAERKAGKAS